MRTARAARRIAGDDLGRAILCPIATGVADGLSYAVFPLGKPASGPRLIERLRRKIVSPHVFRWLRRMTTASMRDARHDDDIRRHFREPLLAITADADIDPHWRCRARAAHQRLLDGRWRPRLVVEHNDLWMGNVLIGPAGESFYPLGFPLGGNGFAITDWAGGKLEGHAIVDLVKLGSTCGLHSRALAEEVRWHCAALGCEIADAECYLLAGLGQLGLNLNAFPHGRYVQLVHHCCGALAMAMADARTVTSSRS